MEMRPTLTNNFAKFVNSQKFSGIMLIVVTAISLVAANSIFSEGYTHFWHEPMAVSYYGYSVAMNPEHFINEILMSFFFLLVGLEIKREVLIGELSGFVKASLPVAAALGGMIIPALFYYVLNYGSDTSSGWGIPMATDIAFALGILALLGKSVPESLKVMLTALAVVDDLGAVIVIALFYSNSIAGMFLFYAFIILIFLLILNVTKVNSLLPYLLLGCALWYCIYKSGIHSTIAGVLLAMTIPHRTGNKSLLSRLEENLHSPVNYLIMPLFAMANTAIVIDPNFSAALFSSESLGIAFGLILGKPIGILLFSWLAVKSGISRLPDKINFKHVTGVGFLGGIGFTMSIFISILAFSNPDYISNAKLMILLSSCIAGILGYVLLGNVLKSNGKPSTVNATDGPTPSQA